MDQTPIPQSVVTIGLKDIYDAVLRLQTTVDILVSQQGEHTRDLADHEARIRTLERARWPLPSLAVLAAVGADVIALLAYVATHH